MLISLDEDQSLILKKGKKNKTTSTLEQVWTFMQAAECGDGVRGLNGSQVCQGIFLDGGGPGSGKTAISGDLLTRCCCVCVGESTAAALESEGDNCPPSDLFCSPTNDNHLSYVCECIQAPASPSLSQKSEQLHIRMECQRSKISFSFSCTQKI